MKDFFGRELNYVRVSVTDRCNYRCRYCMPEGGVEWIPHGSILTYEEIFFLIEILRGLEVKKIRFTGGEPLVRKGMIQFLEKVTSAFPELQVALTTNGSTLTRHAQPLASIGLTSINLSLDTLSPEKYSAMTRGAPIEPVLDGIDALAALAARGNTKIKINAVLMRGFNDDDMVAQMAGFALKRGIVLRFIEFMPLHLDLWNKDIFVPFTEILPSLPGFSKEIADGKAEKVEKNLSGPARYYVNSATGQRVGVISAVSNHFCESCNRLRVTSTGYVRPCLFSGAQISIAEALKNYDAEKLRKLLKEAAGMKPARGTTAQGVTASVAQGSSAGPEKTNMNAIGG